uniref:C2H2-type domain-containing protein n=1 Tax=Panagrolaimus sp. PS1159 TaxID=55785 RepID=A0AC35FMT3_9BILA
MTEERCTSLKMFSTAHNRHPPHQQQQDGEGHYEEEFYGDEYYMDVKHDHDAESVFDIEAEEDAAVSELEIQRNKATSTNSRKYTFIQRPKAQTFVCEYCNKQLRYKSKYLEHLRIHTGERPFTCSFCEASFTQRGALKQHERIHTGSKPHYCLTCDKNFRTASTLNIHLKTHSATDTVIAGFESALQDPFLEDHARIAEELAFEEAQQQQEKEDDEYFQIYEEPESNELTHRWHVNHITQTIVETTHVPPESELNLARFSDGRLQVNDTILEPEHFPMDGVTFYYYTLSNNEILTFMYDEGSNTLEIVETNDNNGVAAIQEEIPPHDTEIPHYQEEHFEDAEGEYEVYEEVLPGEIVAQTSAAEYEAVYENGQQKAGLKDHPPTEYIIDPAPAVVDVEHMNELQVDNKQLITVVAAPSDEMAPEMIAVNKAFYPPTRRKVYPPLHLIKKPQKPKNLEWIINAVAAGKKLEDATPHKRKKPTIKDCEICGLTLKYPSKIAAHMRTHSGEKPFKCDICGRGFAMNTTLRMHIRRHLKEKEYRCTYPDCNKSFVNGALLNYHYQNRHLSRRKFACLRGCGTTFFSNKERERHEKVCIPSMQFLYFRFACLRGCGTTFFSNKERERHEKVCIPSMVHEDEDDDNLQYEEFVNPETGETEKWIFSGYSEESWDNTNMDNVVIEESGQISTIDEVHY